MTSIERSVLGEALREAIGDAEVQALVFTTHDLDPQFFETEILPVFLGNDLKHTQRTRQLQLEQEIRDREVDIDVYYEGRALAAHEGSARLGWSRVQVVHRGGVFHPKVVLALCNKDGAQHLVVAVSSCNLNRGGWWTNLEAADVVTIGQNDRHGYLAGLSTLVGQLGRTGSRLAERRATARIRDFLKPLEKYKQATVDGVLRPTLLPGGTNLPEALAELFGSRLQDMNLEVISPFFDGDPTATGSALDILLDWFAPRKATVALPMRGGDTPVSEQVYQRIQDDPRVGWGRIPNEYIARASGVDAGERSLHAKVYRFWRGGSDPREVVVIGSHNLSGAAHSGRNFEVSVVHEVVGGRQRPLLESLDAVPQEFQVLDPDGADDEPMTQPLPFTLAYDWKTLTACARWDAKTQPRPVTILRAGEQILQVSLTQGNTTVTLEPAVADRLKALLLVSSVVTATTDEGAEGPLLVVELHHDLKPALIEGMDLTPAEILALWSIPSLRERLRRIGRTTGERRPDEPDLDDDVPPVAVSMFEQFAGVFHAFASLRTRIDQAVLEKRLHPAARLLYGQNLESPSTVLSMMADRAEDDPALAYVTFRVARELVDGVERAHPGLAATLPTQAEQLAELLGRTDALRRLVLESAPAHEQAGLPEFLDWFDNQFSADDPEVSR